MKGFVISWFYPPINSSEGLVTFKLLNRSDIKHDVFTQNNNSLWSYNSSEDSLVNDNIKTIHGDGESFESWMKSCIDYFDEHHTEYDFVMSRSMPQESHEAALAIKRKYPHIKWIASFGDPIYNSPYTTMVAPSLAIDPGTAKFPNPKRVISILKNQAKKQIWGYQNRGHKKDETKKRSLEKKTLLEADAVIFNNPYQRDFMLAQHKIKGLARPLVLPHPYETKFYKKRTSKNTGDKVTIVHIGHLDLIRTPINLLKAISRLKERRPDLYRRLDLRFYGTLDNLSKVYMVDNSLFDTVHTYKPVKYFESLEIMQGSDWCLLVDANISAKSEQNIYFAAKLADYIGSGSPILAVTMTDGASADIVRETGNILCSHSVDEIYMTITMLLERSLEAHQNKAELQRYDARSTAKGYDSLLKGL